MQIQIIINKKISKNKSYYFGLPVLDSYGNEYSLPLEIINLIKKNLYFFGSFAFVDRQDNRLFLLRDKYGTQKLFYAIDTEKKIIYISQNFIDLINFTDIKKIFSVKPGSLLEINYKQKRFFKNYTHKIISTDNKNTILQIRSKIEMFLKTLKGQNYNKFFISLSGGLDSTAIAYLAKKIFKNITAVTAVLIDDEELAKFNKNEFNKQKYHDLANAINIAKELKLEHLVIPISKKAIFVNIKNILYACQDWRDFNVHCAVINYFIAKRINALFPKFNKVIITGDFMNEIFADYTEEKINSKIYYKQMRVENIQRQRFFIRGLDSSDREVGVYNYFNISCYQPYCSVIDNYLGLGKDLFLKENPKYNMNSQLLSKNIFNLVGLSKTRAQTGDINGGVLGLFINNNYDQEKLKELFSNIFKIKHDSLNSFITTGMYKF